MTQIQDDNKSFLHENNAKGNTDCNTDNDNNNSIILTCIDNNNRERLIQELNALKNSRFHDASSHKEKVIDYFNRTSILPSKIFDNHNSILHRKQVIMWDMLDQYISSSRPNTNMVERVGSTCTHHVLWLQDEKNALWKSKTANHSFRGSKKYPKIAKYMEKYQSRVNRILEFLKK